MSQGQELICLHTDQHGDIWSLGADGNPNPYYYLSNPLRLRAGTYLILGCPENYKLIIQLYSVLNQKEAKSNLLVGAPTLFRGRNCDHKQVLSCISTLNVHDRLINCWHSAGSKTFNTLLLLHHYRNEGVNDLIGIIFGQHCLQKYFKFLGLNSLNLAVQLINEIVDPRWFLNPKRPYSLSRIESYFGLKPSQFKKLCDSETFLLFGRDNQRRALLLMDIVQHLPADRFVTTETVKIENEDDRKVMACRLVLGFIVRSWLTELDLPGYFDPKRFFKQVGNLADHRRQFKE